MLFVSVICVGQNVKVDSGIHFYDSSFYTLHHDTLVTLPDTTYYELVIYVDMDNNVKVDSCYTVEMVTGYGLTKDNIDEYRYHYLTYLVPGKETVYYLTRNKELLKYKRVIVAFP
jgi:hypothetical protein